MPSAPACLEPSCVSPGENIITIVGGANQAEWSFSEDARKARQRAPAAAAAAVCALLHDHHHILLADSAQAVTRPYSACFASH